MMVLCVLLLSSEAAYPKGMAAPPKKLSDEQVQELIQTSDKQVLSILRKEISLPGLAIALVGRDQVLWTKAYGYRDSGKREVSDTSTIYGLLSLSKTITVTGLLMAVQEGRLQLDLPIKTYLPAFHIQTRFPGDPMARITIRHLLSMTSGLTHDAPVGNNADPFAPSYDAHIESIGRTWLRFEPGTRVEYSNLGVDLAVHIVESVTHRPFAQYVRETLLEPLGMKRTSYDMATIKRDGNRAVGYNPLVGDVPVENPYLASGGAYASINDMARFLQFQLNDGRISDNTLLAENLLSQMRTIPFPIKDQIAGYGMGLWVGYYHLGGEDIRWLAHGGGGFGFQCQMKWLPDLGYGVIVMTNSASQDYGQDRLVEDVLLRIVETLTGKKELGPSDWLLRHLPPRTVDSSYAPTSLTGRYNGTNDDFVFLVRDGTFGYANGNVFEPLTAVSTYEFVSQRYLYRFVCDVDGRPVSVIRPYNGMAWLFGHSDAEAEGPQKKEWTRYVGSYVRKRWGVGEKFYNVVMEHGWLYFKGDGQAFRLTEHLPGLFFTPDGEALDLRGSAPSFRNIRLYKVRD